MDIMLELLAELAKNCDRGPLLPTDAACFKGMSIEQKAAILEGMGNSGLIAPCVLRRTGIGSSFFPPIITETKISQSGLRYLEKNAVYLKKDDP